MLNDQYIVTEQKPSVEDFLALREAVRWKSPARLTVASALDGSLLCVSVTHEGELVGFGRVVGDGSFTFFISDMIVHPDHQRKGLGRAIINRIMGYIEAAGGEDAYIGLMAAPGAVGFYERCGFSARPDGAPGMQRLPMFLHR